METKEFKYKQIVEKNNIKYHTYNLSFIPKLSIENIQLFLSDINNDIILEVFGNGCPLFTLYPRNNIFKINLVCEDTPYTIYEFILYTKDKLENIKAKFNMLVYENREKQRKMLLGQILKTEVPNFYFFKRFGKIFRVSDGVIHKLDEKVFRKTYYIFNQQDGNILF